MNITSAGQLAEFIHGIINDPQTQYFHAEHGRVFYYHEERNILIAENPLTKDGGTCYQPEKGIDDFEKAYREETRRFTARKGQGFIFGSPEIETGGYGSAHEKIEAKKVVLRISETSALAQRRMGDTTQVLLPESLLDSLAKNQQKKR